MKGTPASGLDEGRVQFMHKILCWETMTTHHDLMPEGSEL